MRNNNQKVINNISKKSLKNNKLRNIFAITSIILTTILFTTLFTLIIGMIKSMEEETMRQVGTSAHAGLKYLTYEEYENLKKHPLIKDIGYSILVGFAENKELIKRQTEIRFATDNSARWYLNYPTVGKMPENINELATDTIILDMLGIPHEIGAPITLEYSINGEKFTKDFILCGYWEGDVVKRVSMAWVSKEFIDKNLSNLDQIYQKENHLYSGLIFANIMFGNSHNIEKNIQTVITESGYKLKDIEYGVNWAYMSTNFTSFDFTTAITIIFTLLIIILTGYLIIYNIFQISVTKDIQFYGLLKTIGATSKQIKKLVRKQAFLLSIIGIPIGLLLGYFLGIVLLPLIVRITVIKNTNISTSPIIFIGATIFSLITVYISTRKPSKIASIVSPIEAIRYTNVDLQYKRKAKKSTTGAKIHKMAFSNLFRNKKKTIVVIFSLSLSLILLNIVYTITTGFDMDKYLSKNVVSDFIVGHAKYFNDAFRTKEDMPSQELINNINSMEAIKKAGKVYYLYNYHKLSDIGFKNFNDLYSSEYLEQLSEFNKSLINQVKESRKISLDIYGLNDFLIDKLEIKEGNFNKEKFNSGNYILVSVPLNFRDKENKSYYNIGDKITIEYDDDTEKTYEIMGIAEIPYNISIGRYSFEGIMCFLPENEFISKVKDPLFINYVFDVDVEHIKTVEDFLENYTNNVEPQMDYRSKQMYVDEFNEFKNIFLIIGSILSFIVGFIGILNFINSMLTNIITRKKEFAMMKSIGMTQKQLFKMIIFEGLYYAILTLLITFTIGIAFSYFIVNTFTREIWFFSYHFTILPIIIVSPILIFVSIIIPFFSYKGTNNESLVEQLREI